MKAIFVTCLLLGIAGQSGAYQISVDIPEDIETSGVAGNFDGSITIRTPRVKYANKTAYFTDDSMAYVCKKLKRNFVRIAEWRRETENSNSVEVRVSSSGELLEFKSRVDFYPKYVVCK